MRVELLVIDPQRDFCDPNGSLYVKGAKEDMGRLAKMVVRLKDKLDDIHVTLDSHRKVDISHPIWWRDSAGNHPSPFTIISAADVAGGRWTTTQPSAYRRTLEYLRALEATGRFPHCIWPEHCLIGSEGHSVDPDLYSALQEWETRFALTDFVTKGSNPWTEHFSAVKAEVPDPEDPTTQVNTGLITTLEGADVILLAGEARSHCISHSVTDIVDCFSQPQYVQKLIFLTDCSSDVPGFEPAGEKFMRDMMARGMKCSTSTSVLS